MATRRGLVHPDSEKGEPGMGRKEGFHLSSPDVPFGAPAIPAERGILMADLLKRGRDDMIITNGTAGSITILSVP